MAAFIVFRCSGETWKVPRVDPVCANLGKLICLGQNAPQNMIFIAPEGYVSGHQERGRYLVQADNAWQRNTPEPPFLNVIHVTFFGRRIPLVKIKPGPRARGSNVAGGLNDSWGNSTIKA